LGSPRASIGRAAIYARVGHRASQIAQLLREATDRRRGDGAAGVRMSSRRFSGARRFRLRAAIHAGAPFFHDHAHDPARSVVARRSVGRRRSACESSMAGKSDTRRGES